MYFFLSRLSLERSDIIWGHKKCLREVLFVIPIHHLFDPSQKPFSKFSLPESVVFLCVIVLQAPGCSSKLTHSVLMALTLLSMS